MQRKSSLKKAEMQKYNKDASYSEDLTVLKAQVEPNNRIKIESYLNNEQQASKSTLSPCYIRVEDDNLNRKQFHAQQYHPH